MARKATVKRADTISEKIRQAYRALASNYNGKIKKVKGPEVVQHLAAQGVKAGHSLIYGVRRRLLMQAREEKKLAGSNGRKMPKQSAANSPAAVVQEAVQFIRAAGGVQSAQQILLNIAQLQAV